MQKKPQNQDCRQQCVPQPSQNSASRLLPTVTRRPWCEIEQEDKYMNRPHRSSAGGLIKYHQIVLVCERSSTQSRMKTPFQTPNIQGG